MRRAVLLLALLALAAGQQQMHQQQPPPPTHQQAPPQMHHQQEQPPQMHQQQPPPQMHQQQPPQMHQQQPPQMHQQQPPQMHQQQPPQMHQQQPPQMHQQQQAQMHQQPQMHQQQPQVHQQQMHNQQEEMQPEFPPEIHQQLPPQVHQQPKPEVPEEQKPWYESTPAVALDYKVHVDAGRENCYFQHVPVGATFYVSFQVLRGGDGKAGFAVRNPAGEIVHPYQWKSSADYQEQAQSGGYYSICVDNQFARFAAKLVNLYVTVIKYDQWESVAKELEAMNLSVENVTNSVSHLERNIYEILQLLHFSRNGEAIDYNLLLENKNYVQKWSMLQIVVIVSASILQVYFVRKLFNIRSTLRP